MVMWARRPETKEYDLSSVGSIVCGAAPLSKALQNEISEKLGVQINQAWGMTEVTCMALYVPGGVVDQTGCVGCLLPNCEMKFLDDGGKELGTREPEEIFIRGPNVCLGYWGNEKATEESLDPDGWLKTGDIAVAPAELEAVLLQHEAIADAAVVGVTLHDQECPRAYVALQQDFEGKVSGKEIQDWVKPLVAKHKHLTGGVAFVDEVPKSASGKILRKMLREWAKRDVRVLEKQIKARL